MAKIKEQIYLAALLHDIGKFYERAYPEKYDSDDIFKWSHAVYTRRFYDDYSKIRNILKNFEIENTKPDRNLINLAAKHHNTSSDEEKIIQYADWLSSSERLPRIDSDYQEGKSFQPLLSVFSNVFNSNGEYKKFIPLKKSDTKKLPELSDTPKNVDVNDYKKLWGDFVEEFTKLDQVKDALIFAETFFKLLEKYSVYIPSSTRKTEMPDVSLFDHSKTTAAFSVAIYNYLQESGSNVDSIIQKDNKPFILIGADLSGIQDFIYDIIGKRASKSLKGRSFFIQILMESVVRLITKELGVYKANVVYSAGGNFYIIAQNTKQAKSKLQDITDKINDYLADAYRRKLYLAIDHSEFGKSDLDEGKLGNIWEELISEKLAKKKKQRFLNKLDTSLFTPIDLEEETLNLEKDKVTGEIIFKGEKVKVKDDLGKVRFSTYKQIELGTALREAKYWVISPVKHPNIKEEVFVDPFDARFISDKNSDLTDLEIYNYFLDELPYGFSGAEVISLNSTDFINSSQFENIQGFDFYGGNDFPVYSEDDEKVQNGEVKPNEIKQFDDLARGANFHRLGVLRMDVDNLGKIFAFGFDKDMRTFSRLTALSRSLDWFFRGYLNTIWEQYFKDDTMIIYSGGDDLFIVGRWDKTIQFAEKIKEDFKTWTCGNPNLTLSGGTAVVTGKFPILKAAAMAGEMEDKAKSHKLSLKKCETINKNAFTLLGTPLNWDEEFKIVKEIKDNIIKFSKEGAPKSLSRILLRFNMIRDKQLEHNELYEEGKRKYRVNESWYWMILYYLKRFAERNKKDNELKDFTNVILADILANTYNKKTKVFLNTNHVIKYYALAARWAELDLRTN